MNVTLLTQDQCSYCEQAKEVLERVAAEFPVEVVSVDIASDAGRDLAARYGVLFPPGVIIDGALFSYGRLSERKLRRTLERRRVRT